PVGPQRRADAFLGKAVGHLVRLHAVVEGGDLEAELLGQVDHGVDLVRAVAVDVHADVAGDGAGEGLQLQVALAAVAVALVLAGAAPAAARLLLLPAVLGQVVGGLDEGGAVAGHVAHAGGRGGALAAVHALGVLAA